MWLVVIHMVFVVSGVFLALTDRISGEAKGHDGHRRPGSPQGASSTARQACGQRGHRRGAASALRSGGLGCSTASENQ